MNLFELFVKIGVDDQASDKISNLSSKLGDGLKTAAKIGSAAVGAAAAGITALTTAAVNNYAEYEQLVGGVETLFKQSADVVQQYAANAYKTAGMSANEYMETVTSFSASLLQSLDGDTAAAAEKANLAITDMSDNANKLGTSMEMIQNAYQGFAKQNYTMLDNLKLGYGGTKEEMQRLLDDAEKLSGQKFDLSSYGDIVDAIHVVQTEMGITGTTALEAGRTISGAVGAMKSAWTNLVTGFADGSADIGSLIDNLVGTIVGDGTESNLGVIGNVLPAIENALGGIAKLIEGAAPKIIEILPGLVEKIVPSLISAAVSLVGSFASVLPGLLKSVTKVLTSQSSNIIQTVLDVLLDCGKALVDNAPVVIDAIAQIIDELIMWVGEYSSVFGETAIDLVDALASGIVSNLPTLIETAIVTIEYFSESLIEMLPQIAKLGLDLIVSLANGIAEFIPELGPAIVDVISEIANMLVDPQNLSNLLDSALALILTLASGLTDSIPQLIDAVFTVIDGIVQFLLDPENILKILDAALQIVLAIATGLINSIPRLIETAFILIDSFINVFLEANWGETGQKVMQMLMDGLSSMVSSFISIGSQIVDSIKSGISSAWGSLVSWFEDLWDSLLDRDIKVDVEGSDDDFQTRVKASTSTSGSFKSGLDYVPYDEFVATLHKGERVLTAEENKEYSRGPNGGIQIIQYINSVPQTPVEFASATLSYFEEARWAF